MSPPPYLRGNGSFQISFISWDEKNYFKNGWDGFIGEMGFATIMYCLSADTLVDLYLLAILKLQV